MSGLVVGGPTWLVALMIGVAAAATLPMLRREAPRTPSLPGVAYGVAAVLVAIPAAGIGLMDDIDGPAAPPMVAALLIVAFVSCILAFEWARRRALNR